MPISDLRRLREGGAEGRVGESFGVGLERGGRQDRSAHDVTLTLEGGQHDPHQRQPVHDIQEHSYGERDRLAALPPAKSATGARSAGT